MKNLFLILMIFQLTGCSMNRTYEFDIQKIPDSAYYSNQQLAYIKKGKLVSFYDHIGRLKKELDLESRIEKRYNLTGELMTINTVRNYMFNMGNGYYCYRDLLITPKGTIVNNGKKIRCNSNSL